mmetsp:Transcript_41864/g.110905  ORF Transcript_41864/g.110905 Transcript_41864/m.110905 type:complete len:211 (-) Transcript_41864:797-1429(-)
MRSRGHDVQSLLLLLHRYTGWLLSCHAAGHDLLARGKLRSGNKCGERDPAMDAYVDGPHDSDARVLPNGVTCSMHDSGLQLGRSDHEDALHRDNCVCHLLEVHMVQGERKEGTRVVTTHHQSGSLILLVENVDDTRHEWLSSILASTNLLQRARPTLHMKASQLSQTLGFEVAFVPNGGGKPPTEVKYLCRSLVGSRGTDLVRFPERIYG